MRHSHETAEDEDDYFEADDGIPGSVSLVNLQPDWTKDIVDTTGFVEFSFSPEGIFRVRKGLNRRPIWLLRDTMQNLLQLRNRQ
uniref:Uncharacterized protein n=1 Tax=viral metagenome TaxID=1070528 RepID=A0A6C0BZY5_9ZZZZ